jgi:hypothetical protein
MSKMTERGDGVGTVASASQSDSASRSHWEERLAVARVQREKVLTAQGKPLKKPQVARPYFMDNDPAARLDSLVAPPKSPPADLGAMGQRRAYLTEHAAEKSQIPQSASGQTVTTVAFGVGRGAISVQMVAVIAFACFFGLGFGMVLSFGAVVSMGWISVNDMSREAVAYGPATRVKAPEVSAVILRELTPIENADAKAYLRFTPEEPVIADMRVAPGLPSAEAADFAVQAVNSSAPRLDAIGVDEAPSTGNAFQPYDIFVSFDRKPAELAAIPRLQAVPDQAGDTLPMLPETSLVKVASFVASPTPPPVENSDQILGSANDVMPERMAMPALFQGTPDAMPEDVQRQPTRLVVFDDAIQGFVYRGPSDIDVFVKASIIDTPPAKAISVRAPVIGRQAFDLPEIGPPPDAKPTLAAKLGLSTEAARQVELVTFAPTNVSDERIAANAELLSSTGFPVTDVNRVNFTVSQNHVRYYSAGDEKVARAIAAEIGGPARDFTSLRNAPPPGRVEIWLQGSPTAVSSTTTAPTRTATAAKRRAAAKAQLERSLVNSLRRGDHLKGLSQ